MKSLFRSKLLSRNIPRQNLFQKTKDLKFWSRIKRQIDSFLEPSAKDENGAFIDSNLAMYTEMKQFQAYLTKNAYDMSIYNEYDLWPHTNFGTIDNPLLIFGAGTTWRMVVCSGPGSEEESQSHEKMYIIVREGPIHRCLYCGQCFKLIKLKQGIFSEENSYYSSVFTQISDKVIGNPEYLPYLTYQWVSNDHLPGNDNIIPANRIFVFANADEVDHIMVDPAYRMQYYKEVENDFYKYMQVNEEIDRQAELTGVHSQKHLIGKDVYETWFDIEKTILHYDRIYNRYEKFTGRKLFDPANHERREQRMLQRQSERHNENYTFYFGGLTEQEQMYRDYYESDLEDIVESESQAELNDLRILRNTGDFDLDKFEFLDSNAATANNVEAVEGFVEKLLFRYRYRKVNDLKYERKVRRVHDRFIQRAQHRSEHVMSDLGAKLESQSLRVSSSTSSYDESLQPFTEYVAEEGLQQFKDYYESEIEEGEINLDLINDLPARDRVRFAECYDNNLNEGLNLDKSLVKIPKRPYDYTRSKVWNFVEDLVDFNYRVRPIIRSLSFKDAVAKYQVLPVNNRELEQYNQENNRYRTVLDFSKTGKTLVDVLAEENRNI